MGRGSEVIVWWTFYGSGSCAGGRSPGLLVNLEGVVRNYIRARLMIWALRNRYDSASSGGALRLGGHDERPSNVWISWTLGG